MQVGPPGPPERAPVSTFLHVAAAFSLPVGAIALLFSQWVQNLVNASGGAG